MCNILKEKHCFHEYIQFRISFSQLYVRYNLYLMLFPSRRCIASIIILFSFHLAFCVN